MKQKKWKIFSIIISFLLCVCCLGIGIWAVTKDAGYNMSGTITFAGTGVNANVQMYMKDFYNSDGAYQSSNVSMLSSNTLSPAKTSLEDNFNFRLKEDGTPLTITIQITNLSKKEKIYLKLDHSYGSIFGIENLNTTITSSVNEQTPIEVNGTTGYIQTITIQLSIKDLTKSITSTSYKFRMDLSTEPLNYAAKVNYKLYTTGLVGDTLIDGEEQNFYISSFELPRKELEFKSVFQYTNTTADYKAVIAKTFNDGYVISNLGIYNTNPKQDFQNLTTRYEGFGDGSAYMFNTVGADEAFDIWFSATDDSGVSDTNYFKFKFVVYSNIHISCVEKESIYQDTDQFTGETNYYFDAGVWPQRCVGTTASLSSFVNYNLTSTSEKIYLYSRHTALNTESYDVWLHEPTGRKYIKFTASIHDLLTSSTWTYQGNTSVQIGSSNGVELLFELEPIKWLILGYYKTNNNSIIPTASYNSTFGLSQTNYDYVGRYTSTGANNTDFNPIQDGISLHATTDKHMTGMLYGPDNIWTTSYINDWLNGTDSMTDDGGSFLYSSGLNYFTSDLQKGLDSSDSNYYSPHINRFKEFNNSTSYNQKTTDCYLWLLSRDELEDTKSFKNNESRRVKTSDFAIACYVYIAGDYTCNYFSRTISIDFNADGTYSTTDGALSYIGADGSVVGSYYHNYTMHHLGIRPAMLVSI